MKKHSWTRIRLLISLLAGMLLLIPVIGLRGVHAADDSLCARVKIEIRQELTLERQAFDAHMKITNGLSHISLENIGVAVQFKDEGGADVTASSDPQNTEAKFFIGRPELTGIANVTGSGAIGPSSAADIHWLIIPAPGAAGGNPQGTLYFVGATLSYTMGGEAHVMDVAPDHIAVKPMPEMTIDYFLTQDVYGDDPFTPGIEPPVPFSLGVRVKNTGQGTAKGLKINSAQPKIVENAQQLLIGFKIESTEVNGRPAQKTLLADLGEIPPAAAALARWRMICSLSGQFVEFTADFSHADELGGELTSLITGGPYTHWLLRDVLVDLPGRDEIRDFLALDGGTLRVYESDSTADTVVIDQSGVSSLEGSGDRYLLSAPVTAGFMYVKLPGPSGGGKEIREAIRSDGKRIKPENVWISKTRLADHAWAWFFNIFDANSPGTYTVAFGEPLAQPRTPVLEFIPDRRVVEGQTLSFLVRASNPDGGVPELSAGALPAGAAFIDQKTGIGVFTWSTALGQAGPYSITFTAANGTLTASQQARIIVNPIGDTDGDGMPDAWEMQHFGSLDRGGTGDFDGDGINDLQEYLRGSDPAKKDPNPNNRGPRVPRIQTPGDRTEIGSLQPTLTVVNGADPDGDSLHYTFEVYADQEMITPAASGSGIAESPGTTAWQVPTALNDHSHYVWRVRVTDGILFSPWAYGSFFVNRANEPPGPFRVSSPRDQGSVDTRMPLLQVTNSRDRDEDAVTYAFFVYADSAMTNLAASGESVDAGPEGTTFWTVNVRLADNTRYYWKAVATDEHGAARETVLVSFLVETSNAAPPAPVIQSPAEESEITLQEADLIVANPMGAGGDPLTFLFELDEVDTFDSPVLRTSEAVFSGAGTASWRVSALADHTRYHWRAKAGNGTAESPWRQGSFFVNKANDAPAAPVIRNPGMSAWEDTCLPVLAVNPAWDADGDRIRYRFELYNDPSYDTLLEEVESDSPEFAVSQLMDNGWYYWRARAVDEHGAAGAWAETAAFFVKDSGLIEPPRIALLDPWRDIPIKGSMNIRWEGAPPGGTAEVSLYLDTDSVGEDGTLIASGLKPNPGGDTCLLDATTIPEGGYYIYGVIASGGLTASAYSPARIIVDRTPPAVFAAPPAGVYNSAQTVSLSASEEGAIYFTLDGSEPTETSAIYGTAVQIDETTTLKAVAVDRAGNRGAVITAAYAIQRDIAVQVATSKGRKIGNVPVYAFKSTGSYTGRNVMTDADGIGRFNPAHFTSGAYKFRVDYLGYPFWSNVVTLPGTASLSLEIEEAEAAVSVQTAAGPVAGIMVHLFTEGGTYLGISRQTDAAGMATVNVPVGKKYKFRADILGGQYWSPVTTIAGGAVNSIDIAAGGGVLKVTVGKGAGAPLPGMKTYLFSAGGSYLGQSRVADASGSVRYTVPAGSYKVRADYLGAQFWSETTAVSGDISADLTIAHQDVGVTVNGVFQGTAVPIGGVTVYLFSPAGSYLGLNRRTDGAGRAAFSLPSLACKVRVDYLARQFWSAPFTWQDEVVNIALADAAVTVAGKSQPHAGVPVYAFNTAGSYLGVSGRTNENGSVTLRLPAGSYKFRADYQTHQYWSGAATLAADAAEAVGIATDADIFALTVQKGAAEPLAGVTGYVFTDTGSYLGVFGTTNSSGQVSFNLSSGSYRIRVDYRGYSFWSGIAALPGMKSLSMLIEEAEAAVLVRGGSGPAAGVQVHLFTGEGLYLGITHLTDATGRASFRVPAGKNYKFRVDILGAQYWSPVTTMAGGDANSIAVTIGGGLLQAVILKGAGAPIAGVTTYLFSSAGSYLNRSQSTDATGSVSYAVPAGSYKIRADYLGAQFWSETVTMEAGDAAVELLIAHRDVGVTVTGIFQGTSAPMGGIAVYLFNPAGSYLSQSRQTDGTGCAVFHLPPVDCKVRADYLGWQFWSEPFKWGDSVVRIPMADAMVALTGSGQPRTGIPVYVFNAAGTYLNVSGKTDSAGAVSFRLPAGSYKFRADYQTHQYWSAEETLLADEVRAVGISTGGGNFALTALTGTSDPLAGATCHVFNGSGAYLGVSGATDSNGLAAFDLSSGIYKFRVDYLGYPFWSESFTVPAATSGTLTIPHRDVVITVNGTYPKTEPLTGVMTYLFTPAGSFVNRNQSTDAGGRVVYRLPDVAYKVRADYLGYPFWSGTFQGQDAVVTIDRGAVQVHTQRGEADLAGATVHLFTENGAYLGRSVTTDAAGRAVFIAPSQVYKFRVDFGGRQHWSDSVPITAGGETTVVVKCD